MKKFKALGIIFGFVLLSVGVVFAAITLSNKLSANAKSDEVSCGEQKTNHTVTIQNNTMNPTHIDAALCDTLSITNTDDKLRLMAFGEHDKHQVYDGIYEKALKKDESFTITLNKAGTYTFHDHTQDEVEGSFTVSE